MEIPEMRRRQDKIANLTTYKYFIENSAEVQFILHHPDCYPLPLPPIHLGIEHLSTACDTHCVRPLSVSAH